MKNQILILKTLLRFDVPVGLQLLLGHLFVSDKVTNIADEIIHALAYLLKNHGQLLLVCCGLKGFQLREAFDQLRQGFINVRTGEPFADFSIPWLDMRWLDEGLDWVNNIRNWRKSLKTDFKLFVLSCGDFDIVDDYGLKACGRHFDLIFSGFQLSQGPTRLVRSLNLVGPPCLLNKEDFRTFNGGTRNISHSNCDDGTLVVLLGEKSTTGAQQDQ